jgi:hypothetical protein
LANNPEWKKVQGEAEKMANRRKNRIDISKCLAFFGDTVVERRK